MPFSTEQKRLFDLMYTKACDLRDENKLVTLLFQMLELLQKADEAYVAYVLPLHMGIHPKNRGGKRMSPLAMQKKGHKIYVVGFTPKLCGPDRAIAFEVDPASKHIEKHTLQITSASESFAQYRPGTLRGGSVGCGHLNQWLAAVGCGAKTDFKDLCDPGKSHIPPRLVTEGKDALKNAVNFGLEWLMIRSGIEKDYPEVPSIIQRALNIEHHVGEGSSEPSDNDIRWKNRSNLLITIFDARIDQERYSLTSKRFSLIMAVEYRWFCMHHILSLSYRNRRWVNIFIFVLPRRIVGRTALVGSSKSN